MGCGKVTKEAIKIWTVENDTAARRNGDLLNVASTKSSTEGGKLDGFCALS
jgi:hypothetical protein